MLLELFQLGIIQLLLGSKAVLLADLQSVFLSLLVEVVNGLVVLLLIDEPLIVGILAFSGLRFILIFESIDPELPTDRGLFLLFLTCVFGLDGDLGGFVGCSDLLLTLGIVLGKQKGGLVIAVERTQLIFAFLLNLLQGIRSCGF